jgi:hypothetical protein
MVQVLMFSFQRGGTEKYKEKSDENKTKTKHGKQ